MAASKPADPSPTTAVREQALDALAPDADAQTVVGTTLQALYRHHPAVRLDDILELANHIDLKSPDATVPDPPRLDAQVQQVLDRALAHLVEWKRTQTVTDTGRGGRAERRN